MGPAPAPAQSSLRTPLAVLLLQSLSQQPLLLAPPLPADSEREPPAAGIGERTEQGGANDRGAKRLADRETSEKAEFSEAAFIV